MKIKFSMSMKPTINKKPIALLTCFIFIYILFVDLAHGQNISITDNIYNLKKVMEVKGRQGIAVDSNFYYVSGSSALYKYDKKGKLITSNKKPFSKFKKRVNHIGDIDVKGDSIIAGVEYFNSGKVKNIQIAIYNTNDLSLMEIINFKNIEQSEVAGVCINRKDNEVWMVNWIDGEYIYNYDLTSKKYIKKIRLQPAPPQQQGCYFIDNNILITSDDGDADLTDDVDNIYIASMRPKRNYAKVSRFKPITEVKRTGEIEGISMDPTNGDLLILNNRGATIKSGMPTGFYPGYKREIHELYIYKKDKNHK